MKLYLVGALATFLMVGCGGSSNPSSLEKTTKLSGVAVDDLIVDGVVRAYSASTSKELVRGRTDSLDGSYILDVAYDGVVIIEVTCDSKSLMKNPLTGNTKKCIPDLKLHSAATVAPEKKKVEVNISPISELVVRQMKERGTVSKENLEAAQENIGEMFGFDPLGVSPVENDQYKKVIGAIHEMADAKEDTTIIDVIDDLNEDYKDGEAGGDGSSTISKDFAEAMVKVGANNKLTKNDGVYIPIVKQEEDKKKAEEEAKKKAAEDKKKADEEAKKKAEEDKKKADEEAKKKAEEDKKKAEEKQKKENIELSKQFFNELRTQAMSVIDYKDSGTPGFLDNEAKQLGQTLENVSMDISTATKMAVDHVTRILSLIEHDEDEKDFHPSNTKTMSYNKESDLVWKYKIIESGTEKASGTITLPSANPKDISLQNYTGILNVKFDGIVPLKFENKVAIGSQTLKADMSLIKKDYGSDFIVTNASLTSQGTTVALKDLKLRAYYAFDSKNELQPKYVLFDKVSVEGTSGVYGINGKLEIPEYAQNSSIKDNGFMKDEYETYIHGRAFCLDEHNQRMNNMDGTAVYTDESNVEHEIDINDWGGFYTDIDGNIANLNPDDYNHGGSSVSVEKYGDINYSKYIGLKFDNLSVSSDSCSKIVLEDLNIEVRDDKTNINARVFCKDNDSRRDFEYKIDSNGKSISDITATYLDKSNVPHTLIAYGGNLQTSYDGNSEEVVLDSGYLNAIRKDDFIDFERLSIESSCQNPKLEYLNISTQPEYDHKNNQEILFTYVDGRFVCMDNEDRANIDEATISYTDKSNKVHQFTSDYSSQLSNKGGDFHGRIKGNVESLVLNMGRKSHHAAGFISSIEPDNVKIISSTCANPKISYFNIGLDSNEKTYNSGYLPKKVVFDGNVTNSDTGGYISGNITADWLNAKTMKLLKDSNDKPLVDVSVTGTIQMPEQPEMILNIGYKNPSEDNKFTFNYAYGATTITGTGDFDKEMQNGDIVLTSHNGLKAVIKVVNGDVVYGAQSAITRNGMAIGTLEERQGIPVILYTYDHTFESLP